MLGGGWEHLINKQTRCKIYIVSDGDDSAKISSREGEKIVPEMEWRKGVLF